jgi:hypothetical protein
MSEGINPTQYYGWKKQRLSSATKVFDGLESKASAAEERKEAELQRLKNVIAEVQDRTQPSGRRRFAGARGGCAAPRRDSSLLDRAILARLLLTALLGVFAVGALAHTNETAIEITRSPYTPHCFARVGGNPR